MRYQVKLIKTEVGNIQDAIASYLSVVNELAQESETRYVEVA